MGGGRSFCFHLFHCKCIEGAGTDLSATLNTTAIFSARHESFYRGSFRWNILKTTHFNIIRWLKFLTAERNRFSPLFAMREKAIHTAFLWCTRTFSKKIFGDCKIGKLKYLILHCQMMGVIDTNILFGGKSCFRKGKEEKSMNRFI